MTEQEKPSDAAARPSGDEDPGSERKSAGGKPAASGAQGTSGAGSAAADTAKGSAAKKPRSTTKSASKKSTGTAKKTSSTAKKTASAAKKASSSVQATSKKTSSTAKKTASAAKKATSPTSATKEAASKATSAGAATSTAKKTASTAKKAAGAATSAGKKTASTAKKTASKASGAAKKTTSKATSAGKKTTSAAKKTTSRASDATQSAGASAAAAAPSSTKAARSSDREYDIVVYGATGFVGKLTAEYLAQHAPPSVRIGLAGRSLEKLQAVRGGIPSAAGWGLVVADSSDEASLHAMASNTRVLITTVGPYLKYGLPVVKACAEAGTHYLDLTGEVLFMRRSIDAYNTTAQHTGARIVHSCGFDSIPSDLGVYALHEAASKDGDGALGDTRFAVVSVRGGFSGGTIASLFAGLEAADADPGLARIAADPYSLSPDRSEEPSPGDGGDVHAPSYDGGLRSWTSPFVMAVVNTRVVRRTNALLGYAYSKDFRYREVVANGSGATGLIGSVALTGAMAAGGVALAFGPTRALAERLAPKPGEGPDEKTRQNGRFAIRLVSETADGKVYRGLVAAAGDPGYAATAMMISQCALTLLMDQDRLPDRAGVLTPATGLGAAAIDRLRSAGMTIEAQQE